jgi:hypothetical protein
MALAHAAIAVILCIVLVVLIASKQDRIALLVSSCMKFHKTTLPVMLNSMARHGVHFEDVFVIIGDAPEYASGTMTVAGERVKVFYVPFTSFDHNAMMWMLAYKPRELKPYAWVFQLHDTIEVLPHFKQSLRDVLKGIVEDNPNVAAARLSTGPAMSMGYYKTSALHKHAHHLLRLLNHDTSPENRTRHKDTAIENEDGAFRILVDQGEDVSCLSGDDADEVVYDIPSPYDTDTRRRRELWLKPGFYKYKGNWGVAKSHVDL